eukprot:scaffold24916_cov63-Phaeocystis_antarctica.AAC.5
MDERGITALINILTGTARGSAEPGASAPRASAPALPHTAPSLDCIKYCIKMHVFPAHEPSPGRSPAPC